jgi:hypothetical protein
MRAIVATVRVSSSASRTIRRLNGPIDRTDNFTMSVPEPRLVIGARLASRPGQIVDVALSAKASASLALEDFDRWPGRTAQFGNLRVVQGSAVAGCALVADSMTLG